METVSHFRDELKSRQDHLNRCCQKWKKIIDTDEERIPEHVISKVNGVCGKVQLLNNGKFKQFEQILDEEERGTSSEIIRIGDIHGFWDIICLQINQVEGLFSELDLLLENNFKVIEKEPIVQKKPISGNCKKNVDTVKSERFKNVSSTKDLRAFIAAQKEKNKSLKNDSENNLVIQVSVKNSTSTISNGC